MSFNLGLYSLPRPINSIVRVAGATASTNFSGRITFMTVYENTGQDITYQVDIDNGDKFVIRTSGVYSMSGHIGAASGVMTFGMTVGIQDSFPNTSIASISNNFVLDISNNTAGLSGGAAISTRYLYAGDIIRVMTDGTTPAASVTVDRFQIARIS